MQTLPSELRCSIFKSLAGSLEFYFPRPDARNTPNALGFLTTCRVFHSEGSPFILANATFHCRNTKQVVDLLFSLSKEQICSIRHLTFRGTPFPFYLHPPYCTILEFYTALKLFPGLQLDTLTVQDAYHGPGVTERRWGHHWGDSIPYKNIEEMIKTGKGARELRYIVANPAFLRRVPFKLEELRDIQLPVQPATGRFDSPASDAAGVPGATLSEATSESYDHDALLREHPDREYVPQREILVVVKKGNNCDYVECGSELPPEVKALFESKSWEHIKDGGLVLEEHPHLN